MHLVVRYGGLKHSVKFNLISSTSFLLRRQYSSSNHFHQIPEPRQSHGVGAYTPRPQPNPQAKEIAVLGGGITGLATAYNLSKSIPHANITIYEAKDKLGGWVDSEVVNVDDGEVLFEWGPRTLRPDYQNAGKATLNLILELGELIKDIRGVTTSAPAATNRFVYYPDHLVRMPAVVPGKGILSNLFNMLYTGATEQIFSGVFTSLLAEPTVKTRPSSVRDESVGDFISRRFGRAVADNLLSAIVHGIYAGDIYKLSARTLFPSLWYLETRDTDGNGVLAEFLELGLKQHSLASFDTLRFQTRTAGPSTLPGEDLSYHFLFQKMNSTSVYSFVHGLAELPQHLEQALKDQGNTKILTSHQVQSISHNKETKKTTMKTSGTAKASDYDYVVSTTSSRGLMQMLASEKDHTARGSLSHSIEQAGVNGVNVMVVNLYYQNPDIVPVSGFGYLLPRSIPIDQNPERALGVIFGSETSGPRGAEAIQKLEHFPPSQQEIDQVKTAIEEAKSNPIHNAPLVQHLESSLYNLEKLVERGEYSEPIRTGQDTAPGTKLTVMLGGHWWSDWQSSDLPSEDEAVEMAKSVLARHLKITEQPMVAKARLQRDAIPQYPVGYRDSMARVHEDLKREFGGRLKLAGPWWQGKVGVNDCCKKAEEIALSIREGWDDCTGLEDYAEPEKWYLYDRRANALVPDPMQRP